MYFSAACLIGMRPLLHPITARLPTSFKVHFMHPTKNTKGSSFGNDASDMMRLKGYPPRSHYASMDGDVETGLRRGGAGSAAASEVSKPLPLYHAPVTPYLHWDNGDDDRIVKEIRIETTNVELRRDQYRSYLTQPNETTRPHVYS